MTKQKFAERTRIKELEDCIEGLIFQFGIVSNGKISGVGLSALEEAFDVLGWENPCPAPSWKLCDEPGCNKEATCGWPSKAGYRRTCGKHKVGLQVSRLLPRNKGNK